MNKETPQIIYKGILSSDSEYKPGAVVEGRIFGFPNLKTAVDFESVGYYGNVPYNGLVVEGETIGDCETRPLSENIRDLCIIAAKMRVIGIKRFDKGLEVK